MQLWIQRTVLSLCVLGALSVQAQTEDASKVKLHNVSGLISIHTGGFSLGAGYEYMLDNSLGVGGHLRLFQKDDSGRKTTNGITVIGAQASHHFYKKNWDLYFTPSVNIISIDGIDSRNDATTLGPGLAIGLTWQVASNVAVGFENVRYWVWFDEDHNGQLIDDLAVKVRVGF